MIKESAIPRLLVEALEEHAERAVERDHANMYEIVKKEDKVFKKMLDMIDYIAEHAARNC